MTMVRRYSTAKAAVVLFLAAWPLCLAAADASREFLVEKWTEADGLPSSSVFGLARTKDGFLWVGTDNGAARFDGAQFSVFNRGNMRGLQSDQLQNMAAGPDSQVYIGTWKGGFTVLSRGRARAFGRAEGVKGNAIPVVLADGADAAWFGTDEGYLYHYRNNAIQELRSGPEPRATIYGLAKGPDGRVWVGSGNGLYFAEHEKLYRYRPKVPIPGNGIFDLAMTDAGELYAGNDCGLFQIAGDHWRRWTTKDGLPSDRVQVLAAAPGNVLWIGTELGIAQLAGGQARRIETPLCSATALAFDQEKSLWAGCDEGKGLLRLRQPAVRLLSFPGKLREAGVRSLAEDKGGAVWMATGHGLVRWKDNKARVYTPKDGLPNTNIWAVSAADDGSVWIGTENGFARTWGGKIESFRTKALGSDDPINGIAQDHAGNLWVATDRGLLVRRAGRARVEGVASVTGVVWSVREDSRGNVWAATKSRGAFRLSGGGSQTQFSKDCGLASNAIYDTAESVTGDVWLATGEGLSRIRGGKCANVGAKSGLPKGRAVAVKADTQGHLWLKTQHAVIALEMAEANRVADSGGVLNHVRFLSDEDGFGERLIDETVNSMLCRPWGEMWFAMPFGVGRIDPGRLEMNVPGLKPQVDALSTDKGEHDLSQAVAVQPGDSNLRFAYSAPSLLGTRSREFRYRLTGFDDDWRPGGKQRDAVYTSLPPGKYGFQVSVRRPFQAWSEASPPLEIRILPRFYQTWWWYALLASALMAAVLLGYRIRLAAVRRHYSALMTERLQERSRLARELHDTLAQGMSGIHIQIEAARVLLDVDPKSVGKHLENVEAIAREASMETRRSIAALRSDSGENAALQEMLQEAAASFCRSCPIVLAASIGEGLPRLDSEICYEIIRLVEEALANIRLHSGAGQAWLTACVFGDSLLLEVRDDGRGFEPDERAERAAGHFGITGMRERARRINGRFQLTSGAGAGTRVELEVPFRRASGWRRARNRFLWSRL